MILRNLEHEQLFLDFLNKHTTFVVDIETTGLNTRRDEILGVGISCGNEAFYLVHQEWSHGELVKRLSSPIVSSLLSLLKTKKIITFNGAFDLPFITNYFGVNLLDNLYLEGMLLAHTCDENKFNYGLKELSKELLGDEVAKEQTDMLESIKANGGTAKEYYKADGDLLAKYCMQDCMLTERVVNHFLPQLNKQGLDAFFFDDEVMPLYREVTIPMEQDGIKLDMPLLTQTHQEIVAEMSNLERRIQNLIRPYLAKFEDWFYNKDYPVSRTGEWAQGIAEYAALELPKTATGKFQLTTKNLKSLPDSLWKLVLLKEAYVPTEAVRPIQKLLYAKLGQPYAFNIQSKHHLKKLFFDTLGLEPLSKTPTGQPQVDSDFFDRYSENAKYSFIGLIREYNSLLKIRGTYIERFLEDQEDGRFYPKYFQHRTVSGRHSGDFQQLPRPLEDGPESVKKYTNRIRMFFIADDACNLVGADYESLEPHVFAHVSGDERLREIFRKGHDFYSTIAIDTERLEGVSADKAAPNYLGKVSKAARQRAKAYALGIPYGLTGYKLQFEISCTQEQGDLLVSKYLQAYPELAAWMRRSEDACLQYGRVRTESGRIRRFPLAPIIVRKYKSKEHLLNPLQLWEEYHENPKQYEAAKKDRSLVKNYLNNAKNVQIQGLAASIVARSAIALARRIKAENLNAKIVAAIHDELVVSVSEQDTKKLVDIMQPIMETTYKLSLPLRAEPQVAKRYGETK